MGRPGPPGRPVSEVTIRGWSEPAGSLPNAKMARRLISQLAAGIEKSGMEAGVDRAIRTQRRRDASPRGLPSEPRSTPAAGGSAAAAGQARPSTGRPASDEFRDDRRADGAGRPGGENTPDGSPSSPLPTRARDPAVQTTGDRPKTAQTPRSTSSSRSSEATRRPRSPECSRSRSHALTCQNSFDFGEDWSIQSPRHEGIKRDRDGRGGL